MWSMVGLSALVFVKLGTAQAAYVICPQYEYWNKSKHTFFMNKFWFLDSEQTMCVYITWINAMLAATHNITIHATLKPIFGYFVKIW